MSLPWWIAVFSAVTIAFRQLRFRQCGQTSVDDWKQELYFHFVFGDRYHIGSLSLFRYSPSFVLLGAFNTGINLNKTSLADLEPVCMPVVVNKQINIC